MTSVAETQVAVEAGADAVGFVGPIPLSPRATDTRTITTIASRVPPPTATFLLTSEDNAAAIAQQVRDTGASTVQLVSDLGIDEADALAKLLPMTRRVQVIHIENGDALDKIDHYAPHMHAFLLDSGRPQSATPEYGGTGRTHDWSVSSEFVRRSSLPTFLAGGLSPDNVAAAIGQVRPFGVDLCSGVRTNGQLDRGKLHAFVAAVRKADDEISRVYSVLR